MNSRTTLSIPGASEDPSEHMKLALVIPTLCEAQNIARLLGDVRAVLEPLRIPYEIIVVDDDSRDETGPVVAALAREDARLRLLVRKREHGLAGAILDGWRQSDAQVLGVMDADFQHPPKLLPELFAAIRGGRDLAIGSRYVSGGKLGRWNPVRRLASALARGMTWPLEKNARRARDPLSGFFLVRRRCLQDLTFQRAGYKLLLEILVRGRVGSFEEIPFTFGRRLAGSSKTNLKVGWDFARLLGRLYAERFGLIGMGAGGPSAPEQRLFTSASVRTRIDRARSLALLPFCSVSEPSPPNGNFREEIAAASQAAMAASEGEIP